MFAASPGLHGVEHPVYDVWLVDCKGGKETIAPPAEAAAPAAPPAEAEATAPSEGTSGKKRRSRRVEPTAPPPMENQPIGPADQAAPAPVEPEAAPAPAEDPAASAGGRKKKKRRAEQASPAARRLRRATRFSPSNRLKRGQRLSAAHGRGSWARR